MTTGSLRLLAGPWVSLPAAPEAGRSPGGLWSRTLYFFLPCPSGRGYVDHTGPSAAEFMPLGDMLKERQDQTLSLTSRRLGSDRTFPETRARGVLQRSECHGATCPGASSVGHAPGPRLGPQSLSGGRRNHRRELWGCGQERQMLVSEKREPIEADGSISLRLGEPRRSTSPRGEPARWGDTRPRCHVAKQPAAVATALQVRATRASAPRTCWDRGPRLLGCRAWRSALTQRGAVGSQRRGGIRHRQKTKRTPGNKSKTSQHPARKTKL